MLRKKIDINTKMITRSSSVKATKNHHMPPTYTKWSLLCARADIFPGGELYGNPIYFRFIFYLTT